MSLKKALEMRYEAKRIGSKTDLSPPYHKAKTENCQLTFRQSDNRIGNKKYQKTPNCI